MSFFSAMMTTGDSPEGLVVWMWSDGYDDWNSEDLIFRGYMVYDYFIILIGILESWLNFIVCMIISGVIIYNWNLLGS